MEYFHQKGKKVISEGFSRFFPKTPKKRFYEKIQNSRTLVENTDFSNRYFLNLLKNLDKSIFENSQQNLNNKNMVLNIYIFSHY